MQMSWQPVKMGYCAELLLDLPPSAGFMYRTSNNMVQLLSGSCVFTPAGFEGEYESQDLIVVGDEASKKYILAGAVTAFRSMTYFKLVKRGRFHSVIMHQPHIKEGMTPEEVVVLTGDDWRELMIQYAETTAKKWEYLPLLQKKI